jgi:DNA-binding ferritin-like protein
VLGERHEREEIGRDLEATVHERVDSYRELFDTVAERAVDVGFVPDEQAQAVVAGWQLSPAAQEMLVGGEA